MKFGGERGRYLKDGLHPDVEGQQLMGRYIAKENTGLFNGSFVLKISSVGDLLVLLATLSP